MKKPAFIFPGQGSQRVGMLSELATKNSTIQTTFNQASEILGYNLWDLVQTGPQELLNLTERTQPLLLTASVAIYRIWLEQGGVEPGVLAGHSLGEWSALVCSGALDFNDAVRLVKLRGKYMQEAVPEGQGSMAAIIGLDDRTILEICEQVSEDEIVSTVNFNSPGQVVIAGNVAAVDRACVLCKDKGAKRAMPLAVSAPFHSVLLKPAADKVAEHLAEVTFKAPKIPVVHNVNADIEENPDIIKRNMIEQIYHPVLWVACVNRLVDLGASIFVECGPGKVLSSLNKRIDKGITSLVTEAPADFAKALVSANA